MRFSSVEHFFGHDSQVYVSNMLFKYEFMTLFYRSKIDMVGICTSYTAVSLKL